MRKCLIYGAGRTGKKVLQVLQSAGATVLGFIDEYSAQTLVNGTPVLRLSVAAGNNEYLGYPVIISVFNPNVDMRIIVENLSECGFKRIIDFYTFYREHGEDIGELYWLDTLEKMTNLDATTSVGNLLADQKSIDLLDSIIKVRTTYAFDSIPLPDDHLQYCPRDIVFPDHVNLFADCGAFTGDSIASVVSTYGVDEYYCFEPDQKNFEILRNEAAKVALNQDVNFTLLPCGVWEKNEILKFRSDSAGGAITSEGGIAVQGVALDSMFAGRKKPNYIKMDVEGAELSALRGAQNIISNTKPTLAICVYHKPEDLWEIPLFIHSLNPEYQFYLRQYEYNLFDTVLYAV